MANSQVKTIDIKTAESLYRQIRVMAMILEDLRKKVAKLLPAKYGSELWWEKSDEEAITSIKAGRGKKFKTYEDAVKYLTSGKSAEIVDRGADC
jgi:hypothetical protein